MSERIDFPPDLFRGAATFYARFRPPYPRQLIDDLIGRVAPSGQGRMVDLACGTGQVALPLSNHFAQVIAVLGANSLWQGDEPWVQAVLRAIAGFRPADRQAQAAAVARRQLSQSDILARAGFEDLENREYTSVQTWTADAVIGLSTRPRSAPSKLWGASGTPSRPPFGKPWRTMARAAGTRSASGFTA